ncbi:MAG: imelysin family protein [Pseudomonadota bacterium]
MRWLIALIFLPAITMADSKAVQVADIVDSHILPGFAAFEDKAAALSAAAATSCAPEDAALRAAYHAAYDAWVGVAHLQIGPMETTDLGFAVQFWPDPKGKTPKALRRLIAAEDASVDSAEGYAENSVAARGVLAMERMLFDEGYREPTAYACRLTRAIARDLALSAAALRAGWTADHAAKMRSAANEIYPTHDDALRKLYTTLMSALEFNAEARIARPLGTLQRPRPKRAEARRSGRSLRTLALSNAALADLADRIAAAGTAESRAAIAAQFADLAIRTEELDQPTFDGPGPWFDIDLLRQEILNTRNLIDEQLGKEIGLFVGFNARDGD